MGRRDVYLSEVIIEAKVTSRLSRLGPVPPRSLSRLGPCYLLSRWKWGRPLPTPQPTEIAAD
jgi:hypothetical protein